MDGEGKIMFTAAGDIAAAKFLLLSLLLDRQKERKREREKERKERKREREREEKRRTFNFAVGVAGSFV